MPNDPLEPDLEAPGVPRILMEWLRAHRYELSGDGSVQPHTNGAYRIRWREEDENGCRRQNSKTLTRDLEVAEAVRGILSEWKADDKAATAEMRREYDRDRKDADRHAPYYKAVENAVLSMISGGSRARRRELLRQYNEANAKGAVARFLFAYKIDPNAPKPRTGRPRKGKLW